MITSIKYDNLIQSNLKSTVSGVCKNITNEEKEIYPSFPVLLIQLRDSPEMGQTFIPKDNGSKVSYKIQCYTLDPRSKPQAKEIMDLVDEEMRRMGFYRPSFQQVAQADPRVFSYMAYYERPIMSGDTITNKP